LYRRRFTIGCGTVDANSSNSLSVPRRGIVIGAAILNCALSWFGPAAYAQDDEPAPDTSLEFTLTPGVWLCRLRGDSTLGPAAPSVSFDQTLQLENHEPAFDFEASVLRGEKWKLDVSGFYFETEARGTINTDTQFGNVSLANGDAFEASFQMVSVAVQFGAWRRQPYCIGANADGTECRVALRAGPVIGLRDVYVEQHVESELGGDSANGEWLIPFAGLQLEIRYNLPDSAPLLRSFTIDGGATIGPALGGDGGRMTQLHAGITGYFSQNFAIGFGYRLLELDAENGDYEFNGGLQGLFLYASVRF